VRVAVGTGVFVTALVAVGTGVFVTALVAVGMGVEVGIVPAGGIAIVGEAPAVLVGGGSISIERSQVFWGRPGQ
jgi:hypothetical protein